MYECCKLVGDTPCGLGVWMGVGGSIYYCMSVVSWWVVLPVGWGVPLLVYECCKLVFGTSCGLGVGVGGGGSL